MLIKRDLRLYAKAKQQIQYVFRFAGVYSSGATPVPIPNTEVKSACGDGIAGLTLWESSTMPALFLPSRETGWVFLFLGSNSSFSSQDSGAVSKRLFEKFPRSCFSAVADRFTYFRNWQQDGTWESVHDFLRRKLRRKDDRVGSASAAIIGSQTMRVAEEPRDTGRVVRRFSRPTQA